MGVGCSRRWLSCPFDGGAWIEYPLPYVDFEVNIGYTSQYLKMTTPRIIRSGFHQEDQHLSLVRMPIDWEWHSEGTLVEAARTRWVQLTTGAPLGMLWLWRGVSNQK